jgi:predicted transposase/invertase (TIGR01784 family)
VASSPETQDEYYRWVNEQMRQQGMIQGAVKKAEERAERRTREIARSLLSSNMPIADVAKHTGLSEDEIKKL